jgi:hypothetical protein
VRAAVLVIGAVLLLAAGGGLGYLVSSSTEETETLTTTSTATDTETVTEAPGEGLPDPVQETRAALLEAAEAGDYEALRPFIPEAGFEYTFGGPVEGGPISYWRELERTTTERPLETLASVLKMPYTLSRGYYVWPWAYTVISVTDLSEHERRVLAPLGDASALFVPGTGYLGWRTGIAPDGTWAFFIAGD